MEGRGGGEAQGVADPPKNVCDFSNFWAKNGDFSSKLCHLACFSSSQNGRYFRENISQHWPPGVFSSMSPIAFVNVWPNSKWSNRSSISEMEKKRRILYKMARTEAGPLG
jgi:hypothetical protein